MRITWLGQLSLLIETRSGSIMIDPYLTDHLRESVGEQFTRSVPVNEAYLNMHPDMILLTHVHGDHTDIPSLRSLLDTEKRVEVLAGANAWKKVREAIGGKHNYIMLTPGTEWSSRGMHIRAIPAFHSDDTAVGFLIHAEGKTVYVTGDTLYSKALVNAVDEPVDAIFAVMNGMGNNMNYVDAVRLAKAVKAQVCMPMHWGMFEEFSENPLKLADEARKCGVNVRVLDPYKSIELD